MVDCGGLENRCTARYPGFESLRVYKISGSLTIIVDALLAQLVEQRPSKAWVLRSNRSGITEKKRKSNGVNIVGFLFFFYKCL